MIPKPTFDPFAQTKLDSGSKSWLWATSLQALVTSALVAASYYAEGGPRERPAQLIAVIGIVATWSLALRTIRERLLELMRHWQKASRGLLRKASQSGRHLIAIPLTPSEKKYISGSIWRLRIIAAGITIPFFLMPLMWSFISVVLSVNFAAVNTREYWAGVAVFTLLSAVIVAGYFHWVILPLPAPVRVSALRGTAPRPRRM